MHRAESPGRGDRERQPCRELLKARLVHQVLDQSRGRNHEPEALGEAIAVAADQEHRTILLVEQHRRLGLGRGEAQQRLDQSLRLLPGIGPVQHLLGEAGEPRGTARCRDHDTGNARPPERVEEIGVPHDTGDRQTCGLHEFPFPCMGMGSDRVCDSTYAR